MADDRYKYFRVEARSILDQLSQGALDLEKGAAAPDLVARLLRLAHTLKGAARVVKQRDIADDAHALEDILAPFRDDARSLRPEQIDRVLSLIDDIGVHVGRLTPSPPTADASGPDQLDQPLPVVRPAMDDLDVLLAGVFEAHARLGTLRPRLAEVEHATRVATLVVDQLDRPRESDAGRAGSPTPHEKARSMASDLRGLFSALERDLVTNIDQLDRELRQVREAAERLRLTPVSALFTFLERAVRDVAKALGKRVVFEATGGDVRVDAVVLNAVQGALLHVVRNAVTHGIENSDAERIAAQKPVEGRVTLRVSQRGRFVSFACTDDGRGVDFDAVRRTAQARGLGPEDDRRMGSEELLRALLKGGISTSRTVTALSGRGVGLDVVREAAERLGGEVAARTEKGTGTTIDMIVPLSVASFDALLVEAFGDTTAIPLYALCGSVRLASGDVIRTEQRETILFEGRAIALATWPHSAGVRASIRPSFQSSAIIVRGHTGVAAFRVDRIVGVAEIVMRPLPDLTPTSGIVAGATLDAVGDPLLVFDPDSLVAGAQQPGAPMTAAIPRRLSVLVVDDSLTTRMLEQSILESAGYDVELATSGEEGLDKARAAEHALFLVDVEMPGMDGFTFVERIRADPALQQIPAILVTSRNAPEDLQRGRDVGAQAYMVKSEFDQGVLLERIRTLVA